MHLITHAALAETTGGVCLVIPHPAGIDQLTAIFCALAYLPDDSRDLADAQIRKTFKPGQKVRVLPDGFVYRVAGDLEIHGKKGYFLQYLDAKKGSGNGRFGIWGGDLKRLEPTERSRPLGPDRSEWSPAAPTLIDSICGTETLGNHALLKNRVILLGARSELESFLDDLVILPAGARADESVGPIGCEFPWGSISEAGEVYIEHPRSTPGEPLLAATRNFVAARAASDGAEEGTRIFVSRWLEGCIQNFQNLSRIVDRQRVILLVEASERDRLDLFRRDGWVIWEPTASELLGTDPVQETGVRCVDRNMQSARNDSQCRVTFRTAVHERLSTCYQGLRSVGELVREIESDEDGELLDERVEEQCSILWSLFLQASSWISAPDEEQRSEFLAGIGEARLNLAMLLSGVPRELLDAMRRALDALRAFAEEQGSRRTTPKGEALLEALDSEETPVLALGGAHEKEHARLHLEGLFPCDRIVSVAELREQGTTEHLVGCSVMSRKAFARLMDPCPSSSIELVGYDFEQEIYHGRLAWRAKARARLAPDPETRERLSGFPAVGLEPVAPRGPDPRPEPRENPVEALARASRRPRLDLPKGEQKETDETREARLCRFTGCSWAIFTPGHSISVIGLDGSGLRRKNVDDLVTGEHVLLRESGDKDVIRLIAEDIAGPAEYALLCEQAQRWRDALRAISSSPLDLWSKLRRLGLHRDPVTIRYWLLDDGVIGPRSQDDLSIIVEGAGGQPDDRIWSECWDAICRLRSLHMRAGMKLTDILEAECRDLDCQDFEHEQALDLSLGLLWLVRVAEVRPSEHWPAGEVNQLVWGSDDWREQRMRSLLAGERT
ncbi:DISARM anti-phage system protein DrmE domain-containing protein [Tsuneonella sp. SYSU-LHT278]|uniref:DISARM anti-phage system protein DrmE domain-containing protein n=1 Tax=Tsuneonella sediminis TaxID=3416089 RepID=UPI003F79607B